MKTIVAMVVVGAFMMLIPEPVEAKDASVDHAFQLCTMIDGTGLTSKPCDVSGWGSSVNATIDMSASEARKLCSQLSSYVREQGMNFSDGWTLKIFSPYSGESTIAYCAL